MKTHMRSINYLHSLLLISLVLFGAPQHSAAQKNLTPEDGYTVDPLDKTAYRTVYREGYITLKDGTRIDGTISLFGRCFNDVTDIYIHSSRQKKVMRFSVKSLRNYGLNTEPEVVLSQQNAVEDTPNYLQWETITQEGAQPKYILKEVSGYIKLKDGTLKEGMLSGVRKTHALKKPTLDLKIKLPDGSTFSPDVELVASYGVSKEGIRKAEQMKVDKWKILPPNQAGVTLVKNAELEMATKLGLVVDKNPELETSVYGMDIPIILPKLGYVVLKDGTWKVGEVLVRDYGYIQVVYKDFHGETKNYNVNKILYYGYIKTNPRNEYPSFLYAPLKRAPSGGVIVKPTTDGEWRDGYAELADGSVVKGKLRASSNSQFIEQEAKENLNDPCYVKADKPVQKSDITKIEFKLDKEKLEFSIGLVKRFGLDGVLISELTKQGVLSFRDERRNFHPGTVTLLNGGEKKGQVAYMQPMDSTSFYGVYFAESETSPLTAMAMNQIKTVVQDMEKIQEYDPTKSEFLASKEMNTQTNLTINGYVMLSNGQKAEGNIKLDTNKVRWYPKAISLTNSKGVIEIFDRTHSCNFVVVKESGVESRYIPYRGVFVKVIKEMPQFAYFRNPFPTTESELSELLSLAVSQAQAAGSREVAEKVNTEIVIAEIENGITPEGQVDESWFNPNIKLTFYKKEYIIWDTAANDTYMIHNTSAWGLKQLLSGCNSFLLLEGSAQREYFKLKNLETGEGLETTLNYVTQCSGK